MEWQSDTNKERHHWADLVEIDAPTLTNSSDSQYSFLDYTRVYPYPYSYFPSNCLTTIALPIFSSLSTPPIHKLTPFPSSDTSIAISNLVCCWQSVSASNYYSIRRIPTCLFKYIVHVVCVNSVFTALNIIFATQ
jgi:hypothetical protein